MARYDDLNTSAIAYGTFVSSIVLVVTILLVQTLTYNWILGEEERKLTTSHYPAADDEITKQKAKLDVYEQVMVDVLPASDGTAPPTEPVKPISEKRLHIPLKQSQTLLLKELSKPAEAASGT